MGNGALKNTLFHFTRWFSPKSISKIIYDQNQSNRLKLLIRAHWYADSSGTVHKGGDFYSLEWDRKVNDKWKLFRTLTKNDFYKQFQYGGWFADIESLDAKSGSAILIIAEYDAPNGAYRYVNYTIREWDLINNKELKLIRECNYPKPEYIKEYLTRKSTGSPSSAGD